MTRIFSPFGGASSTGTGGGGLPAGGTAGQILVKQSAVDGDAAWEDQGPRFLPPPDLTDEADATYFYFGWEDEGGSWLVQRQDRLTSETLRADISNNPGFADLTAAWPNRVTLTYA